MTSDQFARSLEELFQLRGHLEGELQASMQRSMGVRSVQSFPGLQTGHLLDGQPMATSPQFLFQYWNWSNKILQREMLFDIKHSGSNIWQNFNPFDNKDIIKTSISKAPFVKVEYAYMEMFCINAGFIFSSPRRTAASLWLRTLQPDRSVHF